ncbi:MAG TPA: aldo/keto reductase [Friedmanniella sp.]
MNGLAQGEKASAGVADGARRIGLGLAALGRPAYITSSRTDDLGPSRSVSEMADNASTLLDVAYGAGVRHVDCARSYGRAERSLGGWLSAHPDTTDLTVASKWGYRYVGGWRMDAPVHEVKDHSLTAFETQLAETRAELGSRLDIYQIHSLTPDSPALHDPALHRRLAALRDEGVEIGFSTSGPRQADVIRSATALRVDGAPLFSVVQSTWNLLEPSAGPALAEAAAAGLRVVVKEAVANGRLTTGEDDPAPAVREAARLAAEQDVSLDQVALAAVLAQRWVSVVLSGAVTKAQLLSNLAAARVEPPVDRLEAVLARRETPDLYWHRRSERSWA